MIERVIIPDKEPKDNQVLTVEIVFTETVRNGDSVADAFLDFLDKHAIASFTVESTLPGDPQIIGPITTKPKRMRAWVGRA